MKRSRIDRPSYPVQLRQAIAEWLPTRGLPLMAAHRWADRLLAITMLLMVFSAQSTLKDRFGEARDAVVKMYQTRKRPGKSFAGFMGILTRHSGRLIARITGDLRRTLPQRLGTHWRIGKWLVFGVDGTKMDCPRTRANQKRFKNGGKKKSGPQLLLVCLIHLGSGLLWSWRQAGARGSESGLLRQLLVDLPKNVLLVADAGFVGYDLLKTILAEGHSVLIRAGANVRLLKKLGYRVKEREGIVYLWPEQERLKGQKPLMLRMIILTTGRNRRMCLLTDVLSTHELSEAQASKMYRRRWGMELSYRGLKQTLARRKMLSDSAAHVMVELDWSVLGQWLISLLLWEHQKDKMPAHEGLAQTLRIVRQALRGGGDQRGSLVAQLRNIRRDEYVRASSKKARNWPHKKNEKPCGIPKVRTANPRELRAVKRLLTTIATI